MRFVFEWWKNFKYDLLRSFNFFWIQIWFLVLLTLFCNSFYLFYYFFMRCLLLKTWYFICCLSWWLDIFYLWKAEFTKNIQDFFNELVRSLNYQSLDKIICMVFCFQIEYKKYHFHLWKLNYLHFVAYFLTNFWCQLSCYLWHALSWKKHFSYYKGQIQTQDNHDYRWMMFLTVRQSWNVFWLKDIA